MGEYLGYLLVTVVPGLIGLVVGGLIGVGLGHVLKRLYTRWPAARKWASLVPWRALVVTVPVPLLITATVPLETLNLGLGAQSGMVGLSSTIIVFAAAFVADTVLRREHPQTLLASLEMKARTLLVACLPLGYFVWQMGGTGVGPGFNSTWDAYGYWLTMLALAAIIDVLVGVEQVLRTPEHEPKSHVLAAKE